LNIIADTNILARAVLDDDVDQSRLARRLLADARIVTVPLVAVCELAWLLSRSYRLDPRRIAHSITSLLESDAVICDRGAIEAGLAMMEAGGDFADGVIAFEGRRLGGEIFASFDKKAVALLRADRHECLLLQSE
jgi:predicted nucleic-acid-binding protein